MSMLSRSVLRHLLCCRALSYRKNVCLRQIQPLVCVPEGECTTKTTTWTFRKQKHSSARHEHRAAQKQKEENLDDEDESVPLVVKLMRKGRSPEPRTRQGLSVDQLQKSLENIKWDTDAKINRANVELEVERMSQELEDIEGPETDSDELSVDLEMRTIEDIYLDDDVPRPQSIQKVQPRKQIKGTPDPSIPPSDVPCSGCGAALHCQDPIIPGYLPSEKFKCLTRDDMRTSKCQRCFFIQTFNMFLNVRVSAETYPQILKEIKHTKSLVLVVVDLFDVKNSIFKDLLIHIGLKRPLFIVGNKVDLLPNDGKGYLQRVKQALVEACNDAGLNPTEKNFHHVCLVSAKTGYGIENLVTQLMRAWKLKGHVYVVGSTNAGKSTLFNALLMSDYCKSLARGFINRATVSVWPGTTLNLLTFPIINPSAWRLALRAKRLLKDEEKFVENEMARRSRLAEYGSIKADLLTGHVGLTDFRSPEVIAKEKEEAETIMGQKLISFNQNKYGEVEEVSNQHRSVKESKGPGYQPDHLSMYWCNDTPGVVNPEQIINLLEPAELVAILPRNRLKPQCVVIKPGQVLFITGLGRIDFVQGHKSIYLTAHVAHTVKLRVKEQEEANEFYLSSFGTDALVVPSGDRERLMKIPALIGREFHVTGNGWDTASADIQLSSLGWVSVAAGQGMKVTLRAYTPGGKGLYLRSPALLPNFTKFRGKRKGKTPFYRTNWK